ncbi:hypothetical protein RHMOL_Rhmol07G0121700 [Rhododendron molle]|uniref:Uncharacterized protein n=1 Tax=Rhododendron molle TaxID=49168 RepID=A0ACC0N0W4_RHOML|nr:hypothetical protein RHMOL_Rhmol07G0121700 [Rhododendron molle]
MIAVLIGDGCFPVLVRWMRLSWLSSLVVFVCQSPNGACLESSAGRGVVISLCWSAAAASEDRDFWGRPLPAAGLYIWERSAWLNGEAGLRCFVRQWWPEWLGFGDWFGWAGPGLAGGIET